ncbi:MAG: alpha/beta fold hydrolase [Clostridia bacterium]|nr:alpha/beta fold hydrolase [Clostridia bacterium]
MFLRKKLEEIYRSSLFSRHDIDGSIFYFSASDFEGLSEVPFNFKTKRGDTLKGYFYFYGEPDYSRIVVFDHGLSVGHRAYFRETEALARHGYTVYTFDHTGCTESEGEGIYGFVGSLSDLDACLTALKEKYPSSRFSVVGHSRGGYSTLNIPAFHPDVTHIVAISGFSSVKDMQEQLIPSFAKKTRAHLYTVEASECPDYVTATATDTLKCSTVKALIIHSADDRTVSVNHYRKLESALKDMPNIRFILVNGKVHNPHYTADAVQYKDAFFKTYKKLKRKKKLVTDEQKQAFIKRYDWHRMTAQDRDVWAEIFKHLDS